MTNTEKLAAAEEAYHDLVTGQSVRVFVDQNGERVEYTAANQRTLARYIQELKQSIAGQTVGGGGPLRIFL